MAGRHRCHRSSELPLREFTWFTWPEQHERQSLDQANRLEPQIHLNWQQLQHYTHHRRLLKNQTVGHLGLIVALWGRMVNLLSRASEIPLLYNRL